MGMHTIEADVRKGITSAATDTKFLKNLIVQGLLMLLEGQVSIRCRKQDERTVQGVFSGAQQDYAGVIKQETGASKSCTLSMDSEYLPDSCLGGVMLLCQGGKITI